MGGRMISREVVDSLDVQDLETAPAILTWIYAVLFADDEGYVAGEYRYFRKKVPGLKRATFQFVEEHCVERKMIEVITTTSPKCWKILNWTKWQRITNPRPSTRIRTEQKGTERSETSTEQKAAGCAGPLNGVLKNLEKEELINPQRLRGRWELAVSRGLLPSDDRTRLNFFSAAEMAIRKGKTPEGMFRATVERRKWEYISQEDEDRAIKKIKEVF